MTVPKRRVKAHVMRPIPQPISTSRAAVVVAGQQPKRSR